MKSFISKEKRRSTARARSRVQAGREHVQPAGLKSHMVKLLTSWFGGRSNRKKAGSR